MTTESEFRARVAPYEAELHAYCYRMLASAADADDALQDALLGAWRGLSGFEGRSSLRSWLYKIAANACLRLIGERPKRLLAADYSPAATGVDIDDSVSEPVWLEPYPDWPGATIEELESVELAFVAALQHLPANQRAVLVLRDVLGFESAETAELLGTSVASINSALQRARQSVQDRVPKITQQATLRELGNAGERQLVEAYMRAWGRADVDELVTLLRRNVRFSMPPIPTWFDGREAVARFFRERVFATPWRLVPLRANGQLAFACYQGPLFRLGALNVVALQGGEIAEITGFLEPAVHARFRLPDR